MAEIIEAFNKAVSGMSFEERSAFLKELFSKLWFSI